jgi:hypothetical protein
MEVDPHGVLVDRLARNVSTTTAATAVDMSNILLLAKSMDSLLRNTHMASAQWCVDTARLQGILFRLAAEQSIAKQREIVMALQVLPLMRTVFSDKSFVSLLSPKESRIVVRLYEIVTEVVIRRR